MKTAEEFVSKWSNWWITNNNKNVLNRAFENELKEIIEQAQKEAYNQALGDAAKKAKVSLFDWINGGFKEFKQNSNHYSINDGTYVKIDEQSILKLKK